MHRFPVSYSVLPGLSAAEGGQVTHLRPGHCDVLQGGAGNPIEIEHIKVMTTWSKRLQWQVSL